MHRRTVPLLAVLATALATPCAALSPGTDVLVPAAIQAPGEAGSQWTTALYLHNPGPDPVQATLQWLLRDQANPDPASADVTVEAAATLVLEDVVDSVFQAAPGYGALRVVSDRPLVVSSAILNRAGGVEYGQGFEGVPTSAALTAGRTAAAVGLKHDATYRSNIFLIDASGTGSAATVRLLDEDGLELASADYVLGAHMPVLDSVASLGAPEFADATFEVTVSQGAVLCGASRVNAGTGDPLTLAGAWELAAVVEPAARGTYFGTVADSAGFLGGMRLEVNSEAAVESLDLSFPSTLCDVTFGAHHDLSDDPIPLAEWAAGVVLVASYEGGGEMAWTLRLDEVEEGLYLEGTMTATGSGWSDALAGCNGDHPSDTVRLGKQP